MTIAESYNLLFIRDGGMPVKYAVCLGTKGYQENLSQHLLEMIVQESLPVHVTQTKQGNHSLYECRFNLPHVSENEQRIVSQIQKYYLAKTLAEVIFQQFERAYVKKALLRKYTLSQEEWRIAMAKVLERL
ncbi:MAG: hypothetical protein LBT32_04040, partial [Peptococcaceae bacterium]|nr:hypothetical protein [Peptococcaceae bacterium]